MGADFFREGKLPGRFVPEVFIKKWSSLIDIDVGFILGLFNGDALVGAFGALVVEDLNDGELIAAECFWFVNEASRGRGFELFLAFEEEAKKRGASRCSMVHLKNLQPEKLARIYEKRGYHAVETAYFKNLT